MSLVQLFKTLVSIDSPSGQEKEVSNFVVDYLRKLDLNPIQDQHYMIYCPVGDVSNNSILLCAHLDTVEPGRGIKVVEEDGILRSDGTTILGADNKAAVAAILSAVEKMVQNNETPKDGVELLFTVREETDAGIRLFDKTILQSKLAYVFDEGDGELDVLITKAPTIQDFEIQIIGKSSHAARPENGINALDILVEFGKNQNFGRLDDDTTFNIGLFEGGTSTNTVPGRILLKGDLRCLNHKKFTRYQARIEDSLRIAAKRVDSRAVVNFVWTPYSFAYELDAASPNLKRLVSVYADLGISLKMRQTNGGSDAGYLNHIGIEAFSLGSGVAGAHGCEEQISIDNLTKLSDLLKSLATYER